MPRDGGQPHGAGVPGCGVPYCRPRVDASLPRLTHSSPPWAGGLLCLHARILLTGDPSCTPVSQPMSVNPFQCWVPGGGVSPIPQAEASPWPPRLQKLSAPRRCHRALELRDVCCVPGSHSGSPRGPRRPPITGRRPGSPAGDPGPDTWPSNRGRWAPGNSLVLVSGLRDIPHPQWRQRH